MCNYLHGEVSELAVTAELNTSPHVDQPYAMMQCNMETLSARDGILSRASRLQKAFGTKASFRFGLIVDHEMAETC